MSNLGAVRRERFLTIDNPLNPPWGGVGQICFKVRVSIRTCLPNLGAVRRKRFLTIDNPLYPPGVGWVKKISTGKLFDALFRHSDDALMLIE